MIEAGPHLRPFATMTPKRLSIAAATLVVAIVLLIGLLQLGGSSGSTPRSKLTLAQMQASLSGSPPALAKLHAQASEILPVADLRDELGALEGRPLVINKWASWCGPCREEFGAFQRVSVSLGREVAFVGIDSGDTSRATALAFLRSYPVSYPSYYDESGQAGFSITDSPETPVTVFYNRSGGRFIHQGPFASTAKLEADVRRYALDG
jgi:cytochrome c biogenesis protein CcmG, thiol:disulfide interchange protein DsbE